MEELCCCLKRQGHRKPKEESEMESVNQEVLLGW